MATSSFGQGFNCTPIQAITAFSSIINGGKLMRPYVVSQVVDNDGNIVRENSPQVVRSVVSKETSDFVRTAIDLQKVLVKRLLFRVTLLVVKPVQHSRVIEVSRSIHFHL